MTNFLVTLTYTDGSTKKFGVESAANAKAAETRVKAVLASVGAFRGMGLKRSGVTATAI